MNQPSENPQSIWEAWFESENNPMFVTYAAVDWASGTRLYRLAPGAKLEEVTRDQYGVFPVSSATTNEIDRMVERADPRVRLVRRARHPMSAPLYRFFPRLREGESVKSAERSIGGYQRISAV